MSSTVTDNPFNDTHPNRAELQMLGELRVQGSGFMVQGAVIDVTANYTDRSLVSYTVSPLEWNVGEFFFLNLFLLLDFMKDLGTGGRLGLPLKHMSGGVSSGLCYALLGQWIAMMVFFLL
jgi:hypothetical protein